MSKEYFVYLMTNPNNHVLYTGVTNNLARRAWEHQQKIHPYSFTAKYNIDKLVYYEVFESINEAINREKQIKAGSRINKSQLIKSINPGFKDLTSELY